MSISAIKVRGVRVVAHDRRGRDSVQPNLFRQQQSNVCGTFHRRRTGALCRTPRDEAGCGDGAALEKRKESKDV
jgi:hypothetical protein